MLYAHTNIHGKVDESLALWQWGCEYEPRHRALFFFDLINIFNYLFTYLFIDSIDWI